MEPSSSAEQFARRPLQANGMIKIESVCTGCGETLIGTRFGEPDLTNVEANHARECKPHPASGTAVRTVH